MFVGSMNALTSGLGRALSANRSKVSGILLNGKSALSCLSGASQSNASKTIRCYKSTQVNFSIPLGIHPFHWDVKLKDKTLDLIFGDKKYPQFSKEEKQLVDLYQEAVMAKRQLTLPNTHESMMEDEYYAYLNKKIEHLPIINGN